MACPHIRGFRLLVALALIVTGCASGPVLPKGSVVGEELVVREPVALAAVVARPESWLDQTLLVDATITAVCLKKGCWMQVTDAGETGGGPTTPTIMVRWESGCGGRFAFPTDAVGKRALIQGSFYRKAINEEDARHLESESGGAAIAREGFEMNASAVLIVAE